jgi:hypothetical protein
MPMGDAVSSAMQSEENCGSVILEPKYDTLASHFYPSLGWHNGELSGSRLRFSAQVLNVSHRHVSHDWVVLDHDPYSQWILTAHYQAARPLVVSGVSRLVLRQRERAGWFVRSRCRILIFARKRRHQRKLELGRRVFMPLRRVAARMGKENRQYLTVGAALRETDAQRVAAKRSAHYVFSGGSLKPGAVNRTFRRQDSRSRRAACGEPHSLRRTPGLVAGEEL